MLRYFFGPVTKTFAEANLGSARSAGRCLAFDVAGSTDIAIGPGESWEGVTARLPSGWRPDFVALYLPYTKIPECLWSAPVPIVGLAADFNLLWHYYRHCLRRCDLVLTDTAGVEAMRQEGMEHGRVANLFGLEREALTTKDSESTKRNIDVLFIGNLQAAVQRERLKWLGRVAWLGARWRVTIHSGVFGDDYWKLMRQARIVFNRSVRGECNKRAFEAALAGALLVQEEENREVREYFSVATGNAECVLYRDDNLEEVLDYYLEHEEERQAIAAAGQRRVRAYGFEGLWQKQLLGIEAEWPELCARAAARGQASRQDSQQRSQQGSQQRGQESFLSTKKNPVPFVGPKKNPVPFVGRVWEAVSSSAGEHADLVRELAAGLVAAPQDAGLHNALGLLEQPRNPGLAAAHFGRAVEADAADAVAGLNLAEAFAICGKRDLAVTQAQRTLATLSGSRSVEERDAGGWDSPHFPNGFNMFRVEWERAAWSNAGQPDQETRAKQALVRWRLHALVAELTGDIAQAYEAVLNRPDLPASRSLLGNCLLRGGRAGDSIEHLAAAVEANPFDNATAQALFEAYGATGRGIDQRRLAAARRLLAKAAAQAVPQQPWFMKPPPVGDELTSIIILCCNQVEYTRQCLQSVLRQTRQPYELVLVDNGSSDGTDAYLDEVFSLGEATDNSQGRESLERASVTTTQSL